MCLNAYPEDIDVIKKERREMLLGLSGTPQDSFYRLSNPLKRNYTYKKPVEDLYELAKTPRALKNILRHILLDWDNLHGEIDFDHLLVARFLKMSAPEAVDFISENIDDLRKLSNDEESSLKDHTEQLDEIWKEIYEDATWDRKVVYRLIKFLFPYWDEDKKSFEKKRGLITPVLPQGVQNSFPIDYWNRINLTEIEIDELRDQSILKPMVDWKKDRKDLKLIEALSEKNPDPEMLAKFSQFGQYADFEYEILNGEDLRAIASSVFERVIRKYGISANQNEFGGIDSLWRLSTKKPISKDSHLKWVSEEVSKALHYSLRFANDLYYFWKYLEPHDPSPGEFLSLRTHILNKAKEIFGYDPLKYLSILDPNYAPCTYHFCILFSQEKEGGTGFYPEEWIWFADLLVRAGNIDPQIMIPQIAPLMITENWHINYHTYTYEKERIEKMFQDSILKLMKIMSKSIDESAFDDRTRAIIQKSNEIARGYL